MESQAKLAASLGPADFLEIFPVEESGGLWSDHHCFQRKVESSNRSSREIRARNSERENQKRTDRGCRSLVGNQSRAEAGRG